MGMLGIQIKRTYERDIATKGWEVTRKRIVEIRDPIHDTLTNQLADQSDAIIGQSWYDQLVAGYEFEGNADDRTDNGHDGTPFNLLYAAGIQGQQACFNGTDSRVVVPDHDDFSFNNGSDIPFSFAGWANFTTLEGGPPAPVFTDTFNRSDRNLIGDNAEVPTNPWFINPSFPGGISNIVSNAFRINSGATNWSMVNAGSNFGYNNIRLQYKWKSDIVTGGGGVNFGWGFNAPNSGAGGVFCTVQTGLGLDRLMIVEGASIVIAQTPLAQSLIANTQYYCEMDVTGPNAIAYLTTGNYNSLGGTIIFQVSTSSLSQTETTGTHIGTNSGREGASFLDFDEVLVTDLSAAVSAGNVILSKMDRNTLNEEWLLYVDTITKKLAFRISTDKDNYSEIQTDALLAVATQYHIIVTNDGTGISGTSICINGVNQTLDAPINVGTYAGMSNTSQNVVFGAWYNTSVPEFHLDGKLDQWLIAKNYLFTVPDCTFLYNSGVGRVWENADPAPPEDDDQVYRAFITQVKEDHRFIEEGILKSGDAVASFLFSADLLQEDIILDSVTGKQYEIMKIETPPVEGGLFFQKFVALKWVDR